MAGAKPVVDEVLTTGTIRPETLEGVERGALDSLKGGVKDLARGMRDLADIFDAPDPAAAPVASPQAAPVQAAKTLKQSAPIPARGVALPVPGKQIPSVKEVTARGSHTVPDDRPQHPVPSPH